MTISTPSSGPQEFVPGDQQLIGARFLVDNARCMLVADPGLGKTSTVLLALDYLTLLGSNVFPVLVLAPKRVADVVWTSEVAKWKRFQHMTITQIVGTETERLGVLRRSPASNIYVINYELIQWLLGTLKDRPWPFKIVVADECSKLKSFRLSKGGVRSAALSGIARYTGRWWNLTGTPSPNGLKDLWGQMWFIDFGERLKRSYTAFSEAFLMEHPYTHKISMQAGADTMIHSLVADKMIAFRAEDWLDITKEQIIPVPYKMGKKAQALYEQMEREFFVDVGPGIEAGTAMVKSTKLLQMVAGSIYDKGAAPHHIHDDRLDALDTVLTETGNEPVLVSYWWKTDANRLLNHLKARGVSARVYAGKQDEADWNAGKVRVMLLHEQSAYGLNLHLPCRDVFMYTYTWSAELWTQFIGRVGPVRQAQAGKKCVVRVWYAQAAGTIDSAVIDSNFQKISVEDALKRARAQRKQA